MRKIIKLNSTSNFDYLRVFLLGLIILFALQLNAATITWTGGVDEDWNTSGNWDTNTVPTATDDVVIPSISSTNFNAPTIASGESYEVNNFTIASSGRVEIGPMSGGSGSNLTVNGNIDNEGLLRANENSSLVLLGTYTTTKSESFANSRSVYGDLSYSIFSLPYSNGGFDAFNGVIAYEYNNETGGFVARSYGDATVAGKGYFIAMNGGLGPGETTFSLGFGGTPIGADVDVAVTMGAFDNFNLVGNSYTAAISVSSFLANTNNTNNTTGTVYFWDDGGSNTGADRAGDYISVNAMGVVGTNDLGDGTSGVKGTSIYNGHVTTMQGFHVEATANGNVSFTQDMQVAGNNENTSFYRTTNEDERTKIKLSITGNNLYNETLIGFDENATLGDDYSLDATKFSGNSNISFYSLRDDKQYAIQALPALSEEQVLVNLGFNVASAGDYQLNVEDLINIPSGFSVWLDDALTGISYDLSLDTNIAFTSAVTDLDTRFSLRFQPSAILNLDEYQLKDLSIISGNVNGLLIDYPSALEQVSLYDTNGRVLLSERSEFTNNQLQVNIPLVSNQIYILRVANEAIKFKLR